MSIHTHVGGGLFPTTFSNIKRYKPNEPDVEAIQITKETLQEAARWCGGEVRSEDVFSYVAIPSLEPGPIEARIGSYLVRRPDGKFDVVYEAEFNKKYHVIGQRQDGVAMRGGLINDTPIARPSGWGANSDSP